MGATPGDAIGRLTARAKRAAATLKAEYEAGRRGDDAPPATLWPSPLAQLDTLLAQLGRARAEPEPDATLDTDAAEVSRLLADVDWAAVRESAGSRSTEAVQAVKAMAAQVDWAAVQPVAAQASSALIAAVASGRLPVGGRTGALVARAMLDQGGLGQRVGRQMAGQVQASPDLRRVIDVVDAIAKPPAGGAASHR